MSAPASLQGLRRIGWRQAVLPAPAQAGDRLGRVVAPHRASLEVHDGEQILTAQPLPRLRHQASDASERPTVGDWVWLRQAGTQWQVIDRLPRHSVLLRGAAGERYGRQALAANVDRVIIVCGCDRDFNPRRIERYLALVQGSGATPLLVLTKADQCDAATLAAHRAALAAVAADCPLLWLNARDDADVARLANCLTAGETAVLVGSSGAGKSTLTNALAGTRLATGEVRRNDGRGRHTTVSRQLVPLPGGACLIDTPGLREIKFSGDEAPAALFEDIEQVAADCRFRDCSHDQEPGCAVQAAVASGALDAGRLANWRKLAEEARQQQLRADADRARRATSARRRR